MLSKPRYGWTTVSLEEFKTVASYLDDIPFSWLKSCLLSLKESIPTVFHIEEEGSKVFIVSYYGVTHVVRANEVCRTYTEIDFMDIARELIADIETYFEDWVQWSPYERTEEDWTNRRIALRKLLRETEDVLVQQMEKCHKK